MVQCLRYDDTLASRQTVGLDHDWRALRFNIRLGRAEIGERLGCSSRNVMRVEKIFGEGFRAFESSGRLARAETRQPSRLKVVRDAVHEGDFRSDDRKASTDLFRKVRQRGEIAYVDGNVFDLRLARSSRIARYHVYPLHRSAQADLPSQRVFAPAGAYDQYLHVLPRLNLEKPDSFVLDNGKYCG